MPQTMTLRFWESKTMADRNVEQELREGKQRLASCAAGRSPENSASGVADETKSPNRHAPRAKAAGPVPYVYKEIGETTLRLLVFAPEGTKPGDRRPAIVFFFGGGYVGGNQRQFEPQARYFCGRGLVAILADYRVKERHGSTPEDSCADGRSAIRWLRQHAAELGLDPRRLVASGGSAGGGVAAMAGVLREDAPTGEPNVSSRPDALILFNPVVVYAPIEGTELRPSERLVANGERWGRLAIPEVSPWHHVTAGAPPTLILHGEADEICPLATERAFADKMGQCGVRCDLVAYPGQGHGFFNARRSEEYFVKTLMAADRFLASLGFLQGEPEVEDMKRLRLNP